MNAIGLYRVGRWCYLRNIPLVPALTTGLTFILFNSFIPASAEIGAESRFAYGGMSVVIHEHAKIGKRVIIGQNVTIGRKLDPSEVPVIGDDVYIAAGSRIIGQVTIGSNTIIGVNSVVNKDVPSNTICAGVPAKVLREIDVSIYSLLKNIY